MAEGAAIATAAITGGTAVLSGSLGYLGARLQPRAEIKRAELEHAEAGRNQRRVLYREYMQKLLELPRSITPSGTITASDFSSWGHDVFEISTSITLFADGAVADAVREQIRMIMQFREAVEPADNATLFSERLSRAWTALEPEWLERNRAVIEFIRADVGAPGVWEAARGRSLTGGLL